MPLGPRGKQYFAGLVEAISACGPFIQQPSDEALTFPFTLRKQSHE
jgi:hypothetical protein